jgi:riboflavin kinase / FMN adenylyltransferase
MDDVDLGGRRLHLAIGMFDGVHLGHQSVIEAAVHSAKARSAMSGVLTFWPHPSALFRPEDPTRQIMDPVSKARLFIELGADLVIEQPFNRSFSGVTAEAFLPYLRKRLPGLESIYVGENWRFGRGRVGDVSLLVSLARREGVDVVSMPRLQFNGEAISSSRIREALTEGRIEEANSLLGRHYFTRGVVTAGRGLGRTIGFPTLNLPWSGDLRPRYGVYGVRLRDSEQTGSEWFRGVANYGVRPTVEDAGDRPLLEVHVLEERCPFDAGAALQVEWLFFVRPETRFSGVEELQAQIARDCDQARSRFFNS